MIKVKSTIAAMVLALTAALLVAACGGGGGSGGATAGGTASSPSAPVVRFASGQAASAVIGQPDFITNAVLNPPTAASLNGSYASPFVYNGALILPDEYNNRTLVFSSGIPATNGANASYAIGQPDLVSNAPGTSASAVYAPQQAVVYNGKLIQADLINNRVLIYNTVPASGPGTANVVVGQIDMNSAATTCDDTHLSSPQTVAIANGKLVVTDSGHNRVLIWNSIPTANGTRASMVLGQANFTSCGANGASGTVGANNFNTPAGVWSDGTRLVIADQLDNRVLIWNSFPTSGTQNADLVLGQPNFTTSYLNGASGVPSATTLDNPFNGVYFTGSQLFVADTRNCRVLIWNSFPTQIDQAANVVLGQANMATNTCTIGAANLWFPSGVLLYGKQLLVADPVNKRYLVFQGQ